MQHYNMKESEYTSIKVTKILTSKLKQLGTKGQTYEDIIWKLIDEVDKK